MREAEVPVTFLPAGKTVYVLAGTRVIEAAAEAGIIVDSPCGGAGICGKCRVIFQTPAAAPADVEERCLSRTELENGYRLACQSEIRSPATIFVPQESLMAAKHQILIGGENTAFTPGETEAAQSADIAHFKATSKACAIAVDVGTTTLAALLMDLNVKTDLAAAARLNPQTQFGDDVLSRILFARDNPRGLQILRESIIRAVNEMIGELCAEAGIDRKNIAGFAFSGNTAMQHLLCGMNTDSLGRAPFLPASAFGFAIPAAELGLEANPQAEAYLFPIIGGFVGGDTVAGILASGLTDAPGPAMLVDIGTNGEIVLWTGESMNAASTAAGPAFEGARISCGMRGCDGAIEKVLFDGRLRLNVIGGGSPAGLCGSGLIDAAAELLRHKILTPRGKLLNPNELPEKVPPELKRRIVFEDGTAAFLLVPGEESATGKNLALTQRDFRELQLATGAIRAGIGILLKRAGLKAEDLRSLLVAGGFGNFIRRENAQRIGLLPPGLDHHRIRFCGNTSLAGARLAAVSPDARRMAEDIARRAKHVELSADADFQDAFAEAMFFPE